MRVNVVHPAGRLARQARREIVIDVADRVIEQVEHFEDGANTPSDLITTLEIHELGRFRSHRRIIDERARTEIAETHAPKGPVKVVDAGAAKSAWRLDVTAIDQTDIVVRHVLKHGLRIIAW